MSTPACPPNAGADAKMNITSTGSTQEASSDARAIAYVFAVIGVVTVAPFALLGQHFAPNVASNLRQQSEVLSQAGDHAGAIAASRRAVEIYRGLTRAAPVPYAPKLATSLHELSVRLNEAGDDANALAAIREAAEIRRGLARFGATDAARLQESLQLLTRITTARRGELPSRPDLWSPVADASDWR